MTPDTHDSQGFRNHHNGYRRSGRTDQELKAVSGRADTTGEFTHELLLYAGAEDFVARTVPFIRDALAADEPILVMVPAAKIDLLRSAARRFGRSGAVRRHGGRRRQSSAHHSRLASLVDTHSDGGRRLRGIGEPIWPGRHPAQLAECHIHEALLNVAFGDGPAFWLTCPYDAATLDAAVIEDAYPNHPQLLEGGSRRANSAYRTPTHTPGLVDAPLPRPPEHAASVTIGTVRSVPTRRRPRCHRGRPRRRAANKSRARRQ